MARRNYSLSRYIKKVGWHEACLKLKLSRRALDKALQDQRDITVQLDSGTGNVSAFETKPFPSWVKLREPLEDAAAS